MPGISGVETPWQMRVIAPCVGIVMATVRNAEEDKVRARIAQYHPARDPKRFSRTEKIQNGKRTAAETITQSESESRSHCYTCCVNCERGFCRSAWNYMLLRLTELLMQGAASRKTFDAVN
jgi:hypothetical protein